MIYLTKNDNLPVGTVRPKTRRNGLSRENLLSDDVKMSLVSWYDNKVVSRLPTYVTSQPAESKERFLRSEKCYITIDCPQSMLKYNSYMEDSMTRVTKIRPKGFKLRIIFFHMLDMCAVCS